MELSREKKAQRPELFKLKIEAEKRKNELKAKALDLKRLELERKDKNAH